MDKSTYSAGCVSRPIWFLEFKKYIKLLEEGKAEETIKQLAIEENVFSAASPLRGKQLYNTLTRRIKKLPEAFRKLFVTSDLNTQKLITIFVLMESDQLFFRFIFEIYREKLILGVEELKDSDFNIFFKNKQAESDIVAGWKDYTIKKLKQCYTAYLAETGLIKVEDGRRLIQRPMIDKGLEDLLIQYEKQYILKALTGGESWQTYNRD